MGIEPQRQRRRPEEGVLFQVVAAHLDTFFARLEVDGCERSLPGFVRRELNEYLRCGILAHGCCRVHCAQCGKNELVAFSCKRRGFCPSCTGEAAATGATALVIAERATNSAPDPSHTELQARQLGRRRCVRREAGRGISPRIGGPSATN